MKFLKYFKFFVITFASVMFMLTTAYADNNIEYFDNTSSKCTQTGVWNSDVQTGYNNCTSLSSNGGNISWKIGEGSGVFRLMYWVTIDENAASDAKFVIDSEFTKTSQSIDFSQGNSGWIDMGFADCGNIGMTVSIVSDSNSKIFAGALKVERLNGNFSPLVSFTKSNVDNFVFGLNTKNVYINGKAEKNSHLPIKKENEIYILKDDLINSGYTQSISDECISGIDNSEYVNVLKFAETAGKNIFISEDGLVVISQQKIDFNKNTDRLKLRNIYTVLKFGNSL